MSRRRRHDSLDRMTHRHSIDVGDPIGRRAPLGLPCQVHDRNLWFADDPADLERAKALCTTCPARQGCLTGALYRQEPTGVWGGHIFDKGRVVPYRRKRGRPPKRRITPQLA
jgi:WhiB family redox-sensing transcriptional regulator